MTPSSFALPPVEGTPSRLAAAWLVLGVAALLASGLLAILLVGSRTPALQHFIPWRDFFHTALVIHVDLSVLIWFLSFAGVMWSYAGSARAAPMGWVAGALCLIGTVALALAPFTGEGNPLMNNYVPVLRQPLFFIGLTIVGVGFALSVARALVTLSYSAVPRDGHAAVRNGMFLSAATAALALIALVWSWASVPAHYEGQSYYEMLFWGSGHVLQFTHSLLACIAWFWLAEAAGARIAVKPSTMGWLFVLAAAPILGAPVIYLIHPAGVPGHIVGFTRLMEYGHLTMLPLGVVLLAAIYRERSRLRAADSLTAALYCSLFLFAAGGVLGFMIRGANVVIPAHYHGSIVGITLAFMGLTYHLLARIGFGEPMRRLALWQVYVFSIGQFLHIAGLAWSGGYGVQRKVAGSGQVLRSLPEIVGMGMMGIGGLIAIIGGVLFLVVCVNSMRPSVRARAPQPAR